MRRLVLPIAALLTVAACTGDSGGDAVTLPDTTTTELPVQTVASTEAPPASDVAATEPTTSETSTTTTTTTTETTALTSTTLVPGDSEIDELFGEAFALYQEAWAARLEVTRDPDEPALRAVLPSYFDEPLLTSLNDTFDRQAEGALVAIERSDQLPSVAFLEPIGTDEALRSALFYACELYTDLVEDTSTGDVVFDEVQALPTEVQMVRSSDGWRVVGELRVEDGEDFECAVP